MQSQKIVSVIDKCGFVLLKSEKRGTHAGQTFFDTFLCQEHGKNSAKNKKYRLFGKSAKTRFPVSKNINFYIDIAIFLTRKSLFLSVSQKAFFFFRCGTIFSMFLIKKCIKKSWSYKCAPLFKF